MRLQRVVIPAVIISCVALLIGSACTVVDNERRRPAPPKQEADHIEQRSNNHENHQPEGVKP